jgi:hypothetical protein
MTHTFRPSVTVAAIIERDGRFLLIEEETSDGIRLNQPAGHLDPYESLEQAVIRECSRRPRTSSSRGAGGHVYVALPLEIARHRRHLPALHLLRQGRQGIRPPLDDGILRTMWMTRDELAACQERHRSPIVLRCVDDYLAGKRTSLDLLYTHHSVFERGR